MQNAQAQINKQGRATIILDASVLYDLCGVFNDNLATDADNHFTKIFRFLAQHGFNVVIPEVVSIEAGNVLADGTHIFKELFHKGRSNKSDKRPSLHGFLKEVASGQIPGITIAKAKEGDPSYAYVKGFYDAYETAAFCNDRIRDGVLRKALMGNRDEYKSDLGDDEIVHMVEKSDPAVPLFVLTSDGGLKTRLFDKTAYPNLTPRPLLYLLREAGLMEAVGFNPAADVEALMKDSLKGTGKDYFPPPGSYQKDVIERLKRTGFYQELLDVKSEIDREKAESAVAKSGEEAGSGEMSIAMRRFLARQSKAKTPRSK